MPAEDCAFDYSRVVTLVEHGRAVRIAYHLYRGPGGEKAVIHGVLGRCEFGLEISVSAAFLVFVLRPSPQHAHQRPGIAPRPAGKLLTVERPERSGTLARDRPELLPADADYAESPAAGRVPARHPAPGRLIPRPTHNPRCILFAAATHHCTPTGAKWTATIPTLTSQAANDKHGEWFGRDDNIVADGYTMDGLVPTLSNRACEFVETAVYDRPDQPFFLYYAMTTPHNPIVPNKAFVGTSRAGTYGDFVVELDHHVGRLLRKIEELGIAENTIVIFTSDNGPVNRTKGYSARWVRGDTGVYGHDSNGPFSGWKAGLQEGGHRVPFFVRWPEKVKPGGRCSTTIVFNDVFPTLAEMLNVSLDENTAEDGQSFFRALTGEQRPVSFHEAIVHNHSNGTFAIRKGSYKLTVNGPKTLEQVVDDDFPVTFALHDLKKDIEETTDVSGVHSQLIKEMHALLKKYVREGRSDGS